MKKKRLIFVILIVVVVNNWWSSPVYFLESVKANDILYIEVFNRDSGVFFTVKDKVDISYIVSNIQNVAMKRDKVSLGYMGTYLTLKFFDGNGKVIDLFIVNSYDTIRKDPFFYKVTTGNLCVDYLTDLEEILK